MTKRSTLWFFLFISIAGAQAQKTDKSLVIPVQIISAKIAPIQSWYAAQGVARAARREYLSFPSSGKIVAIGKSTDETPLRAGVSVTGPDSQNQDGQFLVSMDDSVQRAAIASQQATLDQTKQDLTVAQAEVKRAQATLELMQQNFNRSQKLYKDKIIKLTDLETAQSNLTDAQTATISASSRENSAKASISAAEAQLEQAQRQLDDTRILAPFSGIISRLNVRVGDYFTPASINTSSEESLLRNSPVVLIDDSAYEITLNLPYFQGIQTRVGQSAYVAAASLGLYTSTLATTSSPSPNATVHSISPTISPTERTIEVTLKTSTKIDQLQDGLLVISRVFTTLKTNAIVIPVKCLVFRNNKTYVYVIENDRALWREVSIGINAYHTVEVTSGLKEGDAVVLAGQNRLVDSALVTIVTSSSSTSP